VNKEEVKMKKERVTDLLIKGNAALGRIGEMQFFVAGAVTGRRTDV
jgi:hypothetical protein